MPKSGYSVVTLPAADHVRLRSAALKISAELDRQVSLGELTSAAFVVAQRHTDELMDELRKESDEK
jgi:hypothetical protein